MCIRDRPHTRPRHHLRVLPRVGIEPARAPACLAIFAAAWKYWVREMRDQSTTLKIDRQYSEYATLDFGRIGQDVCRPEFRMGRVQDIPSHHGEFHVRRDVPGQP